MKRFKSTYQSTDSISLRQVAGLFFLLITSWQLQAQPALYNSGNIRIHEEGMIGFHIDLINNGSFDENLGLAGFYGAGGLGVSGAFMPIFYDAEIVNTVGVNLDVAVGVTNNANFVDGDFNAARNQSDIFFSFIDSAFSVGESDDSKVNGYVSITNKQSFTFPIGDSQQLRPLILNSSETHDFARAAYFFEDPNNSAYFPVFNTDIRPRTLAAISDLEFWRLEGTQVSTITLNWNSRSDLTSLTDDISFVTLVGWNKALNRWQSIGNVAVGGDPTNGFVSSAPFNPDEFEIITFGILAEPTDILTLDNYLLTPNGDGINDRLIIPELDQSPNNQLSIYDRNGLTVFEMSNYVDEFYGVSNVDNLVINREQGLPEGVYFYLISLDDLGLNYQGFLYIER